MSNHLVNMQPISMSSPTGNTNGPDVFVTSKIGLDDLFQTLEGQRHHVSVPMRERNLPASFFRPPSSSNGSSAVHSRDSSLDASGFGVGSPQQQHHVRSASTSAYASKPPVHHHAQHQHQVSSPVASTSSACSPVHQYQHSHPSSPLSSDLSLNRMTSSGGVSRQLYGNSVTSDEQMQVTNNNNTVAQQHYHQHPVGSPAQASTTSATSSSSSSTINSPAANSNANSPVTHPTSGLASIIHARARSLPASLPQFSCLAAVSNQPLPLQVNGGSNNHPQHQQHHHHHPNHLLSSTQQSMSNQLQTAQQPMGKMTIQQLNTATPLTNGQQQQQQQQQHARQHSFDILANNSHHNNNKMLHLCGQPQQTMPQQPQFDFSPMIQTNQTNGSLPSISQLISQPQQSQPFNSLVIQQQSQQSQVPLPEGWVAASAPSGDVYFINEHTRTSTWFHPGAPKQMQMKSVQQKQQNSGMMVPPQFQQQQQNEHIPSELLAALKNMHTSNNINNVHNNNTLRNLQMECERYKQRQEEIMSTPALKSNYFEHAMATNNTGGVSNVQHDPFLSGGIGVNNVLINGMSPNSSSGSNMATTNTTNTTNGFTNGNACEFLLDFNQNLTTMNSGGNVVSGNSSAGDSMSVSHDTNLEDIAFDNFELDNLVVDGIDLLNDVEELLNSNKDSLMTWL